MQVLSRRLVPFIKRAYKFNPLITRNLNYNIQSRKFGNYKGYENVDDEEDLHSTDGESEIEGTDEMLKIGSKAPCFSGKAVSNGNIYDLSSEDYKGRWKLLFFYPLNFTFVCPTEILEFNNSVEEFNKLDCDIIGCSIDSEFSHHKWLTLPKTEGGLGEPIKFPLLSGLGGETINSFGAMNPEGTYSVRATYLIDPNDIIRYISMNDAGVGRNVHEFKRTLIALQNVDETGTVCPANWNKGDKTISTDIKKKEKQ